MSEFGFDVIHGFVVNGVVYECGQHTAYEFRSGARKISEDVAKEIIKDAEEEYYIICYDGKRKRLNKNQYDLMVSLFDQMTEFVFCF